MAYVSLEPTIFSLRLARSLRQATRRTTPLCTRCVVVHFSRHALSTLESSAPRLKKSPEKVVLVCPCCLRLICLEALACFLYLFLFVITHMIDHPHPDTTRIQRVAWCKHASSVSHVTHVRLFPRSFQLLYLALPSDLYPFSCFLLGFRSLNLPILCTLRHGGFASHSLHSHSPAACSAV